MELSGSIKRFPVEKVLQFLNMDGATGILTLKDGKKRRIIIVLDEGNIIDVEDQERVKEERMEEILIRVGRTTAEEYQEFVEARRARLEPIGAILVDRGVINQDEQLRLAKLVYTNILSEALALEDGSYEFQRRENVIPSELADPISVASVMLNAARQEDEWPTVHRIVPHSGTVFGRAASTDKETWDSFLESLTPEEQRIARCMDGISTIRMIADNMFAQEFDVSRLASDLARRGLIVRMSEQESRYADAQPKKFFSFRLGPVAAAPIAIAAVVLVLAFAWKNYLSPALAHPDRAMSTYLQAGRSVDTVNRLRLMRLQAAFYVYLEDRGMPPTSLDALVRGGYCAASDAEFLGGGRFVLKILGDQESNALISATDANGAPLDGFSVELRVF